MPYSLADSLADSLAEAAACGINRSTILRAAEPQKSPPVRPGAAKRRPSDSLPTPRPPSARGGLSPAQGEALEPHKCPPVQNRSTIHCAIKQDAMRNLDTPKAIIIAALIVSATIMFTFRYSFSEARGGLIFNHLTGALMPCSNIYADCQILHARFVESETPPSASEPPAQNQKPGLPEGFEPVKYSLYQPASRPRRVRPTGP